VFDHYRLKFEEKQLAATQARLQAVRGSIEKETRLIKDVLQVDMLTLDEDITRAEQDLAKEHESLLAVQEVYVDLTKQVDEARKSHNVAVKALDQAKKEIATLVSVLRSS
jgi:predicted  nucleic acid-binding Zn-ribbon protein